MDSSILSCCERTIRDLEVTWRRLPTSAKLKGAPPVPLKATLCVHQGSVQPERSARRAFVSPELAVEAVLEEAREPVAVLLGGPGAGKSVALKWTACGQARRILQENGADRTPVPIYVDLGSWKTYPDRTLEESLLAERARQEVSETRAVTWLLDGLDLLPGLGPLSASTVLRAIRERAGGNERFVVSTRPMAPVTAELDAWSASSRVSLDPLGAKARREWVREHCPEAEELLAAFERDNPQAVPFLDTPLLFSMVLSACLDSGKPFTCDEYPGRCGLFKGFVTYVLAQAERDKRISRRERTDFEEKHARIVEGVWWTALVSGHEDRIPFGKVRRFLEDAFEAGKLGARYKAWRKTRQVLEKTGLIHELPEQGAWGVLHQQFAEFFAAKHLARRLARAASGGWFEAELWDHLKDKRLDYVTTQALAILSEEPAAKKTLRRAFRSVKAGSIEDALLFVADVGSDEALRTVLPFLRSDDTRACEAAVAALGRIKSFRAAASLVKLEHADLYVRMAAERALKGMPHEQVVDSLVASLGNPTAEVRERAARLLGDLGDERALVPLVEAMMRGDLSRDEGTDVLRGLDRGRAIALLRRRLRHGEASVRGSAAAALARLAGAAVVEPLVALLKDPEASVRAEAAGALGELKDEQARGALTALLGDPEAWVRRRAAEAVGRLGDHQAADALLSLLRDSNAKVRGEAARTLGTLENRKAVEPLLALLSDSEADVRCQSAAALGKLGGERAVDPLIALLEDPAPRVRVSATAALGVLGGERAVESLAGLARDEDRQVRFEAARALASLKDERAVGPLLVFLKDPDAGAFNAAKVCLSGLQGERVMRSLIALMEDPDIATWVKARAAETLGELGNQRAFCALSEAVKHGDEGLRLPAVDALLKLDEKRALDILRPSPKTRAEIKALLGRKRVGRFLIVKLIGSGEQLDKTVLGLLVDFLKGQSKYAWAAEDELAHLIRAGMTGLDDVSRAARERNVPFSKIQNLALCLQKRLEPWDSAPLLEEQRRSRKARTPARDGMKRFGPKEKREDQSATVTRKTQPEKHSKAQRTHASPKTIIVRKDVTGCLQIRARGTGKVAELAGVKARMYEAFIESDGEPIHWRVLFRFCPKSRTVTDRGPLQKKSVISNINQLKRALGRPGLGDEIQSARGLKDLFYKCTRPRRGFQMEGGGEQISGTGRELDDLSAEPD